MAEDISLEARRVRAILATVKRLAAGYHQLTGRPLGVTGEDTEYVATETEGLTPAPPRMPGKGVLQGAQRIQIKGRVRGVLNAPEFKAIARRIWPIGRIKEHVTAAAAVDRQPPLVG